MRSDMETTFKSEGTTLTVPPALLRSKQLFDQIGAAKKRVFDVSNVIVRIELTDQDISGAIQAAVRNTITREMQPGGLLYKMNKGNI
jgi:hypothetical protein